MGRLIVTNTKVSKIPYCMKESGHPLYSYEELCYYMKSRMALWLEEKERVGLTEKMREWGVDTSDVDYMTPVEAADVILDAGTYIRKEEKEQLLLYMQEYDQMEEIYREKERGDLYLSYGRNRKAYLAYWNAAALLSGEEESSFKASLYHNLGIACCRFFYWKEAKRWFALALDAKDSKESRAGLELVLDMEKKGWSSDGTPVDEKKLDRKKREFLKECIQ